MLSYALRPIAKLCLLHGQPDLIECILVLSMRTLFLGGARGVITLVVCTTGIRSFTNVRVARLSATYHH